MKGIETKAIESYTPAELTSGLGNLRRRIARARTCTELLRRNDRVLADAGFSRELLELGARAWPWRVDTGAEDLRYVARMRRRRAILELEAYDDRALADLAIARADIPRAVSEGRTGIELDRRDIAPVAADSDDRLAA